jgi:hypothetical protein
MTIAPFAIVILGLIAYSLMFPNQIEGAVGWLFEESWVALFMVVWIASVFPIDRLVDARFRELRPLRRRKNAV